MRTKFWPNLCCAISYVVKVCECMSATVYQAQSHGCCATYVVILSGEICPLLDTMGIR